MIAVVGVDPGGRTSAVVVRDGRQLIHAELIRRDDSQSMTDYIYDVINAIYDARTGPLLVAVEDVTPPSPYLGIISVQGILDTAQVLGAIRYVFDDLIVVPSGKHGQAPLRSYPPELVGPNETKGTGELRHARAAFDISWAGQSAAALQARVNR